MKKYKEHCLCYTCIFFKLCKFANPSVYKCNLQETLKEYYTQLIEVSARYKK